VVGEYQNCLDSDSPKKQKKTVELNSKMENTTVEDEYYDTVYDSKTASLT
jgi:hypothetical protein